MDMKEPHKIIDSEAIQKFKSKLCATNNPTTIESIIIDIALYVHARDRMKRDLKSESTRVVVESRGLYQQKAPVGAEGEGEWM